MPFVISSAPEVWQRTVHEFVEDLNGMEVIADDILIAGFGDTEDEVLRSLETNERVSFEKYRRGNLKLNRKKVKRCQSSVCFMGHLLTSEGLKADSEKIQAIPEKPAQGDITAAKRFLLMMNYLSRYLVRLSDMT